MADEVMKVAQESARGSFFLIAGTAVSMVVLALSAILIARLLGSDVYGQYSLVIVLPQLLYLFTDLGLNQGLTKFASDFQTKGNLGRLASVVKHGLILRLLMGISISVFTYVFADSLAAYVLQRPDLAFFVQLSAFAILFQALFTVSISAFVGMEKSEYNALTLNIQSFAKTLIQIVLIIAGFSVVGAIIGHVVSYLIAGVIGLVLIALLLRKSKGVAGSFSFREDTKLLWRYGSPLYLSTVLVGVIPLFQNLVLAFFVSDAEIGNFKAATNFAALMTILSVPIQTIMLPAFSKLKNDASDKVAAFFKIANKYTALIVVPVTFLIIIFSDSIVRIIYGATYNSASQYLWTYCIVYLLVGVGYLTLASFYNGIGETKVTMRISVITFVILFALSPLLTSVYGVLGLIGAYLVANASGQVYSSYYARRRFKIQFDNYALLKIYTAAILASVVPVLMLTSFGFSILMSAAFGGALYVFTYLTLLPLIRVVSVPELEQAYHATRSIPFFKGIVGFVIGYQQRLLHYFS
jgi:O-antigen/teichoic acid export membrane protein